MWVRFELYPRRPLIWPLVTQVRLSRWTLLRNSLKHRNQLTWGCWGSKPRLQNYQLTWWCNYGRPRQNCGWKTFWEDSVTLGYTERTWKHETSQACSCVLRQLCSPCSEVRYCAGCIRCSPRLSRYRRDEAMFWDDRRFLHHDWQLRQPSVQRIFQKILRSWWKPRS